MSATFPRSAFRSWKESQEVLWQYLGAGAHFAATPAAQQIHFGTVIRDATTAYEVYLTGALNELFDSYGRTFQGLGLAVWPSWPELKRQYLKCMECDIEPEPIKRVRALRHVLTHRHGRVETDEEKVLFADLLDQDVSTAGVFIRLHPTGTKEMLNQLDAHVALVQSMVSHFSAGPGRSRSLSTS